MKKKKGFFDRYLEEIYKISRMLDKEGKKTAESRYCEIMAELLLFICDGLRTIRSILFLLTGYLIGRLFCRLLELILMLQHGG